MIQIAICNDEIEDRKEIYGMDELLKLPDSINISPMTEDNNTEKKDDGFSCVVTVGGGAELGFGFVGGLSSQRAFDTKGNIEFQGTVYAGQETGVEGRWAAVISVFPGMESVADSEEFGMMTGLSGGLGPFGGIDILWAGEGDDMHLAGFSILFGEGVGFSAHTKMAYTIKIGPRINVFDTAESLLNWLSKFWTDSKE